MAVSQTPVATPNSLNQQPSALLSASAGGGAVDVVGLIFSVLSLTRESVT